MYPVFFLSSPPKCSNLGRLALLLGYLTLTVTGAIGQAKEDPYEPPLTRFYADRKGSSLFRRVASQLHWTVGLGYGETYYRHQLNGFSIYNPAGQSPRLLAGDPAATAIRFTNWVNRSVEDTTPFDPGAFLVSSDTDEIGFTGDAWNLPLTLSVHYEWKRYRFGAGYSFEYMNLGQFRPTSFQDDIGTFEPGPAGGLMRKYYALLGVSFYRYKRFLLTGDAHLGGFRPGGHFERNIRRSVVVNVGVTAEYEMSEYLRLFVRPAFEFKRYTLPLPQANSSIRHGMNAGYLTVGFIYRIPELPRCAMKSCAAQVNHTHGNREYRSRMHAIWKKQNPGYGENYPSLIKNKGKNRYKWNPY